MVKQVIVMIHKYPDGKGGTFSLRLGKMVAQGSHASQAFLHNNPNAKIVKEWMETGHTKICVRADNEDHLMQIYQQALDANLQVHLVEDKGLTEFKGIPTKTCLAIGPDYSEMIDPITKDLKLL